MQMSSKQLPLFAFEKTHDTKLSLEAKGDLIVYTDGASRGNPGPSGIGLVIKQNDKVLISKGFKIENTTNNVAEYLALLCAVLLIIREIPKDSFDSVVFRADSLLLIKQMIGEYKVRDCKLAKLCYAIKQELLQMSKIHSFEHVFREFNFDADKMANAGIDKKIITPSWFDEYVSNILNFC